MYYPGTKSCKHKEAHYGKNADYRQIVEQFNPQKFNADEWLDLFQSSGAQYIMPVGEHHDGVKMYKSDLNRWNTKELTPHRDFMQELHTACDKRNIPFLIVVSKNGCLMLNVGPRADGSICPQEREVLRQIGSWLKVNGEAIFGTESFTVFGEGKKQSGGAFRENLSYSTLDYRFTYRTGAIYVFPLTQKARREFRIRSLCRDNNRGITYRIKKGVTAQQQACLLVSKSLVHEVVHG